MSAQFSGLDAEAEAIIDEIRSAFRDVSRGSLSLHQAIVKTWTDDERVIEAGVSDSDKHWDEIPDISIEKGAKALYGADPESWRYFLPAFMIWTLRNFKVNDAFTSDQTIYSLDPHSDDSRFHTLTRIQSRAIARFLSYLSEQANRVDSMRARRAFDDYWGRFRDP